MQGTARALIQHHVAIAQFGVQRLRPFIALQHFQGDLLAAALLLRALLRGFGNMLGLYLLALAHKG